jgi:integrase
VPQVRLGADVPRQAAVCGQSQTLGPLGAWWNAARKASSRIAGDYYRFQLLTGCRGVEIHSHKNLGYPPLRVAGVDLQGARVTLRDTKNRSDHRILLSRQALRIARTHCEGRAPEEPLFPVMDARKTAPIGATRYGTRARPNFTTNSVPGLRVCISSMRARKVCLGATRQPTARQ